MATIQEFPFCCSLRIMHSLSYPENTLESLEKIVSTRMPVVFADNNINLGGGLKIAKILRGAGYRVDQIDLGPGAHGTPMHLWIWWTNKKCPKGQKPSRINYVEQREEEKPRVSEDKAPKTQSSPHKPRPAKRQRTILEPGLGLFGRVKRPKLRKLAKRPRAELSPRDRSDES